MLKILSKRERTFFYLTVAVVVFCVAINFFNGSFWQKNITLNREIALTRQKLKKCLRLLSQKESIQNRYNRVAAHPDLSMPQGDVFVATLSELEKMAQDAGVRIVDIRPQDVSKGGGLYKEIAVDLRAEGDIEGYFKFIYNLENSLSLLRVRKFQLSSKTNSKSLEGSFSISSISTTE
ncbi:MAG: GspMb/PilO family protein [Candidatus Omnitrophica bacterium]|nr:GspMb/PilO family protein [Candidatus Omnitrophota bacterium]